MKERGRKRLNEREKANGQGGRREIKSFERKGLREKFKRRFIEITRCGDCWL